MTDELKQYVFDSFPPLDYPGQEALNTLCTNLSFFGDQAKRVMITSSKASEGKTYISMNLMRTLAGLGKRVVLVDADLRASVIKSRYGVHMQEYQGLSSYLAGMCRKRDIVYQTNIEGAYIVPVGQTIPNSLAILSNKRLHKLLNKLSKTFDTVIVDAPPVGVIIDAAEIAKSCTGVVMVIKYDDTSRHEVVEARSQLERTGCQILGVVLNDVTFDSLAGRKYYYKSYYSHYRNKYYGSKSANKMLKKTEAPALPEPSMAEIADASALEAPLETPLQTDEGR